MTDGLVWVAGERPAQHIQEFQKDDIVLVTLPSGRQVRYRVDSVCYDINRGMQITMILEGNVEQH